jgi:hypothetical protein
LREKRAAKVYENPGTISAEDSAVFKLFEANPLSTKYKIKGQLLLLKVEAVPSWSTDKEACDSA